MFEDFIFILKGIILTDVFARALKDWGIFETPRNWIKKKSGFLNKLLVCDECVRLWTAFLAIFYLFYFEWYILTYALILQWLACWARLFYEIADAERANKEQDFQDKLKGGK